MNTHSIELDGYYARSRGSSTIYLGTAGSHGNEQLQVTQGKGWEGLTVQVVFHPSKVAVQLPANGLLDVPWEATTQPLTSMQGRIVFQGFDQDRLVNSTDLAYTVASHSPALGRDEEPYTPGIVEGVLNQMAADKDAILQAAQQTSQAKDAAAASANQAASSAASAQQSAGAANTSAGQAAASASQAAGSAAAAGETLTQVQTAGQEAQQKVKDAETEALDKIAAAAPALPAVSSDSAWQSVTVKPDGTGYNLTSLAPIEATIRPTVTGNPAVCENSAAWGLQGLKIYGKSTRDGTPSPEDPVPIVSAGQNGQINVTMCGLNLLNLKDGKISGSGGGLTYTKNPDSSYCREGTATSNLSNFWMLGSYGKNSPVLFILPAGTYYVNDCSLFYGTNNIAFPNRSVTFDIPQSITGVRDPGNAIIGTAYNDNIYPAIYPGEIAQSWEPYTGQSLTLSTPPGLPGIPVDSGGNYTDASGQQRMCDVVDFGSGKYMQNCSNNIFDGSSDENWMIYDVDENFKRFNLNLTNFIPGSSILCNRFPVGQWGNAVNQSQNKLWYYTDATIRVTISNDFTGGTLDGFRNWLNLNPLILVYQLATPAEADISPEELAAYKALTTYSGTTVVSATEPVAGLEVQYMMDGNKYRESVDKRLAALEAAQTGI